MKREKLQNVKNPAKTNKRNILVESAREKKLLPYLYMYLLLIIIIIDLKKKLMLETKKQKKI